MNKTPKVGYRAPEEGFVDGIYSYEDGTTPIRLSLPKTDRHGQEPDDYLAGFRLARALRNYFAE